MTCRPLDAHTTQARHRRQLAQHGSTKSLSLKRCNCLFASTLRLCVMGEATTHQRQQRVIIAALFLCFMINTLNTRFHQLQHNTLLMTRNTTYNASTHTHTILIGAAFFLCCSRSVIFVHKKYAKTPRLPQLQPEPTNSMHC